MICVERLGSPTLYLSRGVVRGPALHSPSGGHVQTRTISMFGVLLGLVLWACGAWADTGNVCVQDLQPGATCVANDVHIDRLEIVSVNEACGTGVVGEAEVVLRALVSAVGSPSRYDIGVFLALDGASVLAGDLCFHSALPGSPTNTPVYGDFNSDGYPDLSGGVVWDGDGDSCADIAAGTQAFVTLPPLRIKCADIDSDGFVDLRAAVSWDISTSTACGSTAEAFPLTRSRCSNSLLALIPLTVLSVDGGMGGDGVRLSALPNPFAGTTYLTYGVTEAHSHVEISVFDISGRRVRTLVSGIQEPGRHTVAWDGTTQGGARVTSGVYWIRQTIGDHARRVNVAFVR